MVLRADTSNGIIKLGDKVLSGIFQSLSINGEILVDSNSSPTSNLPRKVMRGYKDKTISLSLLLLPTDNKTVYEHLEELELLFRDEKNNVPKVFNIVNPHTMARNIDKVIFTGLSSSENNENNMINVSITFEEFLSAHYE